MTRAPQKRRLATHDKLLAAANDIVAVGGFDAMRVEEVVQKAGVAKGTFFAHFGDKDALMAAMIGERLTAVMEKLQDAPPPKTPEAIALALEPLVNEMSRERIVFDVVFRYSGAASVTQLGPITQNFIDQTELMMSWIAPLQGKTVRSDVTAELLADGVQAFVMQAIALSFCAVNSAQDRQSRLNSYLHAWLAPQ